MTSLASGGPNKAPPIMTRCDNFFYHFSRLEPFERLGQTDRRRRARCLNFYAKTFWYWLRRNFSNNRANYLLCMKREWRLKMDGGMDLILPCALCHPWRLADSYGWLKDDFFSDWLVGRRREGEEAPPEKHEPSSFGLINYYWWRIWWPKEPFQAKTSQLIGTANIWYVVGPINRMASKTSPQRIDSKSC